jgi:hypothetical protein
MQQCPPSDMSARDDVCILQSMGLALHETDLLAMKCEAARRHCQQKTFERWPGHILEAASEKAKLGSVCPDVKSDRQRQVSRRITVAPAA